MNQKRDSANRLRILIIDNKPNVVKDLSDILEAENYAVRVTSGRGKPLIQNALTAALSFRPHVVIVDMRLMDDDNTGDKSGLMLLESLRSAVCIMYSGYLSADITRDISQFPQVTWVDKAESPQKLLDVIQEKSVKVCAAERQVSFNFDQRWSEMVINALLGKNVDAPSSLVNDVIAQLFPQSQEITIEALDQSIVTPQSVSRGRSVLTKIFYDSRIEPLILKITTADAVEREFSNYTNHIRDNLVGQFNARLYDQPAIFWDLGGLRYTLINHPNKMMITFREFYSKQTNPKEIIKPLIHFFTNTWRGLYEKAVPSKESLSDFYEKAFHLSRRLKDFPNKGNELLFPGINVRLLNPMTWLTKHIQDSSVIHFRQCVTHGDLHSDNIIVDSDFAWAIDFERSGMGHSLRDFIELEVDIYTRLIEDASNTNTSIKNLYLLGVVLTADLDPLANELLVQGITNPTYVKALHVIREIRMMCKQNTQLSDFREYLWGLLFDLAFLATLAEENKIQRDRALLYGAIASQRIKEGINQAWPPPTWKPEFGGTTDSPNTIFHRNSSSVESLPPSVASSNLGPPDKRLSHPVWAVFLVMVMMVIILVMLWGITEINPSPLVFGTTVIVLLPLVVIFTFVISGLARGDVSIQVIRDIVLGVLRKFSTNEEDVDDEDSPKN